MARSTFKTLFYINRSKLKKNGKCPIMGRITIDGQQVQYSMGLDINPNNWDAKHGRCKGDIDEMKNINRILTEKEGQIQTKYNELVWQKGYVSAELLKNCLTEDSQSNGMLMEEADRFIEEKRPCVGISIAQSTFRNYIYDKQLIVSFLLEKYGMSDIGYSRLDYGFVEELDFYLKSKRRLSPATIQMTVIFLRKLISIGQQKKYIRRDPFVDFKAEKPRGTRRYLTTEELKRILQTPILNKQFERARQLFIF
ncbi:phage integrase SAM-like domain-containing protein, partial [Prevotella corporis]